MTETNRRTAKKAKTREQIIEAAKALFDAKGYAETTIRDVAKKAGYSTGSVFSNWECKRDLFFTCYGYWPLDGVFAAAAFQVISFAAEHGGPVQADAEKLVKDLTDPNYFAQDAV